MTGSLTVYKASAGSGKTFTLVAEYVALLLAGDPATAHRAILAVTFTNKATAEMKERVLHELQLLAKATDGEESDFEKKVRTLLPQISSRELQSRAATSLHALLHDYDHFRVTTIDSFFQSLLTAVAHELGLSAGFRVEIDDKRVVNAAVDRLLASVDEREDVRRWILDYVYEHIADDKSWDVSRDMKSLACEIMKERFLTHEETLLPLLTNSTLVKDYVGALHAVRNAAADHLITATQRLDEDIKKAGGYEVISKGKDVRAFINKLSQCIDVEPSSTMQNRMVNAKVWLRKADLKNAALVSAAESFTKSLTELNKARVEEMSIINTCDLTLKNISPLRLIGEVGNEARNINQEENRFMLAKTPIFFDRMVGQEDAPFVFERVGERFHHIMIDEFQDTSGLQWGNFRHLLLENMSQGNTCLLVGDVKQAIYRFRGGDWKILNGIDKAFLGRQEVKIDTLSTNYRSCKRIVDFNNQLFTKAAALLDKLTDEPSLKDVSSTYADVFQNDCGKQDGHVEVELIIQKNKDNKKERQAGGSLELHREEDATVADYCEQEETGKDDSLYVAKRIAETIHQLHDEQGVPYRDIAILVRLNRDTTKLIDQLTAVGATDIPIISNEAFTLKSSPAINLLIAALRYLDDESNDLARAYICRAKRTNEATRNSADNALKQSATDRERIETAKKEQSKEDKSPSNIEDGSWAKAALPAFLTGSMYNTLRCMPLYELIEQLIGLFRLDEMPQAAPYLFYFLDAVADAVESGRSTIGQLLELWDEKISENAIPAGEFDGVRILTIHKSKGLAFHTVLIPGCNWKVEKDDKDDWMWCEPTVAPFNTLPLIPLHPVSKMTTSLYAADYITEHHDQRTENLNLIYVAFTRAKQNLYVWATTKEAPIDLDKPAKDITMGDVLRACLGDNGFKSPNSYTAVDTNSAKNAHSEQDAEMTVLPHEETKNEEIVNFASYASHVEFRQSGAAREFILHEEEESTSTSTDKALQLQQQAYIDRGKLLHYVFSTIRTTADVGNALATLTQSGLIATEKEAASLRHLIEQRLSEPNVSQWFDGSWQVRNECNIISRAPDGSLVKRRPDRVMVRDKQAIVVDFKFGRPRPEYKDQVSNYCQLLTRMGYSPVKGYLWYVYDGRVETVNT